MKGQVPATNVADWESRPTLGVEEAGALLGLSRKSAYRAVANGEIPVLRLGRKLRVPTAALRRLLANPSGVKDVRKEDT